MYKFQCLKCGSSELSYGKWIYCEDRALINTDDGFIEYYDQEIDDNNVFGVVSRYLCHICKTPILHHGHMIVTENELKDYLEMTIDQRTETQAEFDQKAEDDILDDDLEYSWSDKMLL